MEIRRKVEKGFERHARWVIRYPWLVIVIMLALTLFLGSGMGRLKLDTSPTSYISFGDPARITYNKYRSLFENDDVYLILVQSDNIYSQTFLHRLHDFHRDIENRLPYLDKVDSIVNARVVRGENDELIVDELLDPMPESQQALELVRKRIKDNPMFVNALVSDDETTVAIIVNVVPDGHQEMGGISEDVLSFDNEANELGKKLAAEYPPAQGVSQQQIVETMQVLLKLQKKYHHDDFRIFLTGDLQMTHNMMQYLAKESQDFVGITMCVIGAALMLLFRRLSGVLLPMLVIILPIAATIGFMGWVGLPMTMSTGNLPTFLFAVCVGDAVHVLSIFYQRLRAGDEKHDAIIFSLSHCGLAILMTSVTTAGALASFVFSSLMPLSGLGIAAPVGVMLAFVYSVMLLPALLTVLPIKALKNERDNPDESSFLSAQLVKLGALCTSHPVSVVAIWTLLVVLSIYGALNVQVTHEPMKWFPEDDPTRIASDLANSVMKGVMPLELVIDSGKPNGLLEPAVMQKIDQIEILLQGLSTEHIRVAQTMSVIQILKETNRALHNNDQAYYTIPDSRELIAQELLLFESSGSDDLKQVVDSQYRFARIHASLPFENGLHYVPFVNKLEKEAETILGSQLTMDTSGLILLYMRSFNLMLHTTVQSYLLALLFITPLMILIIGELRLGLISLIPNLAPIAVGLGIMYALKIPFDMFTMMVGTIAIGVAVDDTIHFMHSFRRYYRSGDSAELAVSKTLHTTGKALLITSFALCAGFFVQMLGEMVSISNSGLITGLTIFAALLADITLSPALVVLTAKYLEQHHIQLTE